MQKYKLTLIGLIVSIFVYVTTIALDLDLFEQFLLLLKNIEQYEFDELIVPLVVFFIFLYLDTRRRSKIIQVENEKLKIYKAMLISSHHILNNFIYQMDIFKLTAEDTPGFDAQTLAFYEDIVSNTSHKINSLSNLTTIDEFSIRTCVLNE